MGGRGEGWFYRQEGGGEIIAFRYGGEAELSGVFLLVGVVEILKES